MSQGQSDLQTAIACPDGQRLRGRAGLVVQSGGPVAKPSLFLKPEAAPEATRRLQCSAERVLSDIANTDRDAPERSRTRT